VQLAKHGGVEHHVREVWKSVAFLARYANQSVETSLSLSVLDRLALTEEIGELLEGEAKALGGSE
jgi:hypothetical protein